MSRKIESVRTRTLVYLLLLLSVVALASYWSSSRLMHKSLAQYETRHAEEELERVSAVLLAETQALLGTALDYGLWDDTYEYVQQGSPDYLDENLTADSLGNLRVDFVAFVNTAGQLHSAFEIGSGQRESLAADSNTLRAVQAGLDALRPNP